MFSHYRVRKTTHYRARSTTLRSFRHWPQESTRGGNGNKYTKYPRSHDKVEILLVFIDKFPCFSILDLRLHQDFSIGLAAHL